MRLYVSLTRSEIERLQALASRERRCPQDQAAHILARALADIDETAPPIPHTRLEVCNGAT